MSAVPQLELRQTLKFGCYFSKSSEIAESVKREIHRKYDSAVSFKDSISPRKYDTTFSLKGTYIFKLKAFNLDSIQYS